MWEILIIFTSGSILKIHEHFKMFILRVKKYLIETKNILTSIRRNVLEVSCRVKKNKNCFTASYHHIEALKGLFHSSTHWNPKSSTFTANASGFNSIHLASYTFYGCVCVVWSVGKQSEAEYLWGTQRLIKYK